MEQRVQAYYSLFIILIIIMKKIVFRWSGYIITGFITSQTTGGIMGLLTIIKGNDGIEYNLLGKCEVGNCGPFTVLSIE